MNVCLCDICKKNEASRKYKIKRSLKGHYVHNSSGSFYWSLSWTPWEKISICGECGEKFFNQSYRGADGFGRVPWEESKIPKGDESN